MNLRQPYEQLIAGKLRQLRAPDADASWQQMKQLLDDDEDTRVGGRKRPPGGNGWWRIGILAIVLSASFWLYVEKTPASSHSLSKNSPALSPQSANKTAGTVNTNHSNNHQTNAIDNSTTLSSSNTTNSSVTNAAGSNTAVEKNNTMAAAANHTSNSNKTTAADNAAIPSITTSNNPAINAAVPLNNKKIESHTSYTVAKTGAEKQNNPYRQVHTAQNGTNNANNASNVAAFAELNTNEGIASNGTAAGKRTGKIKNQHEKNNDRKLAENDGAAAENSNGATTGYQTTGYHLNPSLQPAPSAEKSWFEKLTDVRVAMPAPSFNTSLAASDSLAKGRDASSLLNNETKKGVAKAQRDNEIALLDKKDKKGLHLNLSNVFKPFSLHMDAEPWWAAGIAANANITVHAQNRYNYNMNAKSSLLSDYIPSPYLQFHLNNYVYLQTELNFIAPQYTPQLLAYRQSSDIVAQQGMSQEKSIYIQKMYYFNWPVSLHYSPINNLYLSAGLQFSSFQSGIASIQEKQFVTTSGPDHASSVTTNVLKFKDDSIAAKIAPNEWRWQAGAEYYIDRFSIGVRYNQSFKNAVNSTVSSAVAPTVYRNESLLFFVRYNLFESRSKNTVPKNQ